MRMIGIGLMAFFVAWAVFLLSSHNIPQRSLRQMNEIAFGPQIMFETERSFASAQRQKEGVFFGSISHGPIILTGLPAYQGATFSMPIDARPTSGYLQVDITSQVLKDVKGVLRVSINNTKRGEILLYPGEAGRSLLIQLSPAELVKERLVVSFSTLGSHATQSCSSNDGIDAIVEIEMTSGLYLNLDRAIETPRDRVLSQGREVKIGWDDDFTKSVKVDLLNIGAHFIRNKERVIFAPTQLAAGLSLPELTVLGETLPRSSNDKNKSPHYVAKTGPNFGLRRFYETTNWRIKYTPDQYIDQKTPDALNLNLTLSELRNDAFWTVTITLNGSLFHSEILTPNAKLYHKQITLKKQDQLANNLIEVMVHSSESNIGICNEGPLLFAQMEQSTALLSGDKRFNSELSQLRNTLDTYQQIGISGLENITHHQATLLSRLIAKVATTDAKLTTSNTTPQIRFLGRSQFKLASHASAEKHRRWLVVFDNANDISVWDLEQTSNVLEQNIISPNAIIIELPLTGATK